LYHLSIAAFAFHTGDDSLFYGLVVAISNRNGLVQYDRREYAARLKVAAEEVGVICDDDSSDGRGDAGANRLPLFPD